MMVAAKFPRAKEAMGDAKEEGRISPALRNTSSRPALLRVYVTVGVQDVLLGRALVEVFVALGGFVQADDLGVHRVGDVRLVVQDAHHQAAVVLHDRALAREERVALGPAEAEPDLERALLRVRVGSTRVARDVEARDAQRSAGAGDRLDLVQNHRRGFLARLGRSLEADGVHRAVDLGLAEDARDLLLHRPLRYVDSLASEGPRLREALLVEIAHDHDGGAQELRRVGRRQADRAGAGDVDRRAGCHLGHVGAVVAGREDVAEHGEIEDLLERLVAVRELEEVKVRERHHHVLGLPAYPAAHVHVAVSGAGPRGVDVQADAGLALLAVTTAAAGYVERDRADVADVEELDVRADLDDLARDLVPQSLPDGRRRPAPHHVLVGATDVRRDYLQCRRVRGLLAHPHRVGDLAGYLELRVLDRLYRYLSRSLVDHYPVVGHKPELLSRTSSTCMTYVCALGA